MHFCCRDGTLVAERSALILRMKNRECFPNCKKETLEERTNRKHLLRFFHTTKSTQTGGSVSADRNYHGKKTKNEVELTKSVENFRSLWYLC